MSYSPETQRLLDSIAAGDCCEACGAPTWDRHFDDCPEHPDNEGRARCARAECGHARVDHVEDGPCAHRIKPTMQPCVCTKYEGEK